MGTIQRTNCSPPYGRQDFCQIRAFSNVITSFSKKPFVLDPFTFFAVKSTMSCAVNTLHDTTPIRGMKSGRIGQSELEVIQTTTINNWESKHETQMDLHMELKIDGKKCKRSSCSRWKTTWKTFWGYIEEIVSMLSELEPVWDYHPAMIRVPEHKTQFAPYDARQSHYWYTMPSRTVDKKDLQNGN